MQGLIFAALTASEKHTFNARLNVNNARLDVTSHKRHSSVKSRSRVLGRSVCLKGILRTITMQGLALAALTASEKCTLMLDSM